MQSPLTVILGASLDSAGFANGLELMPGVLRAAGLSARLALRDLGDLAVSIEPPVRDPQTGIIGVAALNTSSAIIRDTLVSLLAAGERPLVLGGCCSLLIGVAAALRQVHGRVGLAFVDGHLDFYDGASSLNGEAADMELALICGIGPQELVMLGGPAPMLQHQDIVVLGHRDAVTAARDGAPDPTELAPRMTLYDAAAVVEHGPGTLGTEVAARLSASPGRFWLHLDLDVLNDESLPAVDYLQPGGLDWDAVAALVRPLAQSPALLGMDVTIYNPRLDPDRRYARQIVDLLVAVL